MAWFDAGVNLLDSRFNVTEVVNASIANNVTRLCIITTHPNEWEPAAELAAAYPEHVCYTVGVHPHNAKEVTSSHWAQLHTAAQQPGVVAIGECGLDFNRNFSPPDTQLTVFKQQLLIAADLQLPVYLHERDAFTEQLDCLQPMMSSLSGGIAHCFTGTASQMQAYLDLGLYIGVTGWVCDDKRGHDLRDAVLSLPLERLILETDAPYLYPKSRKPRQRHNQPAFLPYIGEAVARMCDQQVSEVERISYANTIRLFDLGGQ